MNIIIHFIRIIYPLVQSFKYLKNREQEGQKRILKYWCITWILSLLDIILEIILNQFLVDIVLIGLAIAMVYNKFNLASQIFDSTIHPLMQKYDKEIENGFEFINDKIKMNWNKVEVSNVVKQKFTDTVIDSLKKQQ